MRQEFTAELKALLDKYRYHLQGNMRLIDLNDEKWDASSATLAVYPDAYHGGVRDATGPFLMATVQENPPPPVEICPDRIIHVSSDIAGYDCPVTGKWVDGRKDHRENLKRTGCRNLEPGESRESHARQQRDLGEYTARAAREMVATAVSQLDL